MKLIQDLEFFDIKEDKVRTNTVFELIYIIMFNMVKSYSSLSEDEFATLPENIQKMIVEHLSHINAFTDMCKPIVYEWPEKTEEDAYNAWMQSSLRELMMPRYDKVDESEGTN